jgi:hypothetical protein
MSRMFGAMLSGITRCAAPEFPQVNPFVLRLGNTPPGDSSRERLDDLKVRLLRGLLRRGDVVRCNLLRHAANTAAALAGATAYPLLVFPCLFEETVLEIRPVHFPVRRQLQERPLSASARSGALNLGLAVAVEGVR